MLASSNPSGIRHREPHSTYIVQDRQNGEEIIRLTAQDQMFTAAMGGALRQQEMPARIKEILDIGSGTGGWIIETARTHPEMSFVGIDISRRMVDHANEQAQARGVGTQVKFQVKDALTLPGFADASFDLINLRFGSSYLRTWDWPRMLREMARVTRPGGIIQITEAELIQSSNSAALQKLCELLLDAFHQSNRLFEPGDVSNIPQLQNFLAQQRCQEIQIENTIIEYQAGTPMGEAFYQDAMYGFRTIRPFLQKWSSITKDYDVLYQQLLTDLRQPDFHASINFSTAWGHTPARPAHMEKTSS